jgi:hypothetical protein
LEIRCYCVRRLNYPRSLFNFGITHLGSDALRESAIVSLDLGGLQLLSLGDNAFQACPNLASVSASTPCSLGKVGDCFLANSPSLSSFSFSNISVITLGSGAFYDSGVVTLDLSGLRVASIGDFAFLSCAALTSVCATSPCTLGVVGNHFLAFASSLTSFSFRNISATVIGGFMLKDSGVVEVDVGGLCDVEIGETEWTQLSRVIASAFTTVTHFGGYAVAAIPQQGP